MAGAGAPRSSGERPPSGGGWRTRIWVRPCICHLRDVQGTRRRRPASLLSRGRPDRVPVVASAAAAGCRRHRPDPGPRSETRGTDVPARVPGGPVLRLRRSGAGPASPHTSAPPVRVRALHEGESAVGRGENCRAERRSAAGSAPSQGARAADVGLQAESSARNRVVGHGHPGKRATGLGVLEVERRTASGGWLPWSRICIRSGAGLHLSRRRRAGPRGTSSARNSGTPIVAPARGTRGPDWSADHRVPGPGR
jgi:hypothetical protein